MGACLGSGHPRQCRESGKEVEAEVGHPGRFVTVAQELEELLLVPGALSPEAGVWQPVGWVTVVEAEHVLVSVCVHPLKASC